LLATACMLGVSLSHLLAPYLVKLSLDRHIANADLAGFTVLVLLYSRHALLPLCCQCSVRLDHAVSANPWAGTHGAARTARSPAGPVYAPHAARSRLLRSPCCRGADVAHPERRRQSARPFDQRYAGDAERFRDPGRDSYRDAVPESPADPHH